MLRLIRVLSACASLTLAATACSGGGSSNPLPSVPPATAQVPGKTASASVTITVPKSALSSAHRAPKYITSSVQGISFNVQSTTNANVYGGYVFYALTPSSSYCTSASSGLICTLEVQAYPGADIITVQTYDGTNPATSNVISAQTLSTTINPQAKNVLNFVTNAVVAQLVASIGAATNATSPFTAPIAWTAFDGDGRVIVGAYDAPLSLIDHDTTGATSVSTSDGGGTLNGSGSTASFTYTAAAAPTTLDLQTTSINSANYTPYVPVDAPLSWSFQSPSTMIATIQSIGWSTVGAYGYGNWANNWLPSGPEPAFPSEPFTVSGGTSPYTVMPSSSCSGKITVSGTSPTFNVQPVMGSTQSTACTLKVTDAGNLHTATIQASIHS